MSQKAHNWNKLMLFILDSFILPVHFNVKLQKKQLIFHIFLKNAIFFFQKKKT